MPNKPFTVTVSQLNRKISLMLGGEKTFNDLYIKGEISNLTIHYKSGHIYFTLKDEASSVKAVMFRREADSLSFVPETGMSVTVRAAVRCFERDGVYQLYVSEIIPDGAGAQAVALEQLKIKLEKEGLFSQKRQFPLFPQKICVITAETGAALQDILNIIGRRYPICTIAFIPVLVQGEKAPDSIVNALKMSGKTGAELVIFGRGGGSSEDLSAFNDERVVRAVFDSSIPTISAVGHETDVSLSDFAADLRAPTPSAAAELAVPDLSEYMLKIDGFTHYLKRRAKEITDRYEASVALLEKAVQAKNPQAALDEQLLKLNAKKQEISEKMNALILKKEHFLSEKTAVISALNPLEVLMRGYAIVYNEGKAVSSVKNVSAGDSLEIRLSDGTFRATAEYGI